MMENSIINKLQNTQAFAPILNNDYVRTLKSTPGSRTEEDRVTLSPRERWNNYKNDLKDPHTKAFKYTAAAATTLLVGGIGIFLSRGRYEQFRKAVFDSYKNLREIKAVNGTLTLAEKAKGYAGKTLGYAFNGDKIKDNFIYRTFQGLRFVGGHKIADFSRSTAWFPRNWKLKPKWKGWNKNLKSSEPALRELESKLSGKQRQAISSLLSGKHGDELVRGLDSRLGNIDTTVDSFARGINSDYFPRGHIFKKEFWSSLFSGGKNAMGEIRKGNDLIMDRWNGAVKKSLEGEINGTKGIGDLIETLEGILKKPPSGVSEQSIKSLEKIVKGYKDARKFEVEGYAGRVRDLSLGAGMTEMFVPLIAGGILTRNTMKGQTPEEKKDNFIKNGGIAIVGGLGVWMVTMMMAINGPIVIPISIVTGLGLDVIGRYINKKLKELAKQA